ncbi:MAG: histidinol phosphatase [Candidatus Pseudobacter hemicellulosilyticus]|uniref:protein-tyrosine-phosphatase n=1 Tax=Candidatus Pseudobacter hemicellulosilyticus TaxID=3121375 RepID=A0AAJ5WTL2_9BACT|nr:MAG: histidinol phosphatase [Pseudobacter sp.]
MFSIFKKKTTGETVDLSAIGTDMHSHLLPAIDDGSPDIESSRTLIKGLEELGFRQLITTPHIFWDLYKNDAVIIQQQLQTVQAALAGTNSPPLRAAAEYYIDEHFISLLEKNVPLLTIRDNWVLVEFSFASLPIDVNRILFQLQIKGYQPVLAHPERYTYLLEEKGLYDELKSMGILFQLNLLSLTNYYSKPVQELARYLLKKEYINLLGTDLHNERHLQAIRTSPIIMNTVKALADSGKLLNPSL